MSILSKLLGGTFGYKITTFNCYEVGHVWTPSCKTATFDVFRAAIVESFRIYTSLYLLTTVIRKGSSLGTVNVRRLLQDIVRSSLFLTTNGTLFIVGLCAVRRYLDFFIYPSVGIVPGIIASFFSIIQETKMRRPALALYLLQVVSELFYRSLVHRGRIRPTPGGDVLILCLSLALYSYFYRKQSLADDVANIYRIFYGLPKDDGIDANPENKAESLSLLNWPSFLRVIPEFIRKLSSGSTCEHKYSCVSYSAESFGSHFTVAYGISAFINLATSIPKIIRNPRGIPSVLSTVAFSSKSARLAMFIGSIPTLYKSTTCLLGRLLWHYAMKNKPTGNSRNFSAEALRKQRLAISLCAGFVSGLAMFFYRNSSISLYLAWKMAEIIYFKGVDRGWFPSFYHADIILYTLATAFVLNAGIFEPHALRPAYWHFLIRLTGGRFDNVHRKHLDIFGYDSSFAFRDYFPVLEPLHCTTNPALVFTR